MSYGNLLTCHVIKSRWSTKVQKRGIAQKKKTRIWYYNYEVNIKYKK